MARKRQLQLPGLPLEEPEPLARAKRDLTAVQFHRALARHGLWATAIDRYARDLGRPALAVDPVMRRNPLRMDRRATLAKIVKALRAPASNKVRTGTQNRAPALRIAG